MTNLQESRAGMYGTVITFCEANASITKDLPNFIPNLAVLKETNAAIQIIGEQQKVNYSGITKNKQQLKQQLIQLSSDNARKLVAFAKFNGNQQLLGEVGYSETDFKRFSDHSIKDYALIIYDRIQPIVALLKLYGITAETQATFMNAINGYISTLGTPRMGATLKRQATKQLEFLFNTGNRALDKMDTAIGIIRLSQPNFYVGYKSIRKIIGIRVNKLAVKGKTIDAATGDPLQGVSVRIILNESNAFKRASADILKKSAKKGGFNIKSLPTGTYLMQFAKAGYLEKRMEINVNEGELTKIKAVLEKSLS